MDEFPSNSHKHIKDGEKTEPKKIERVIEGEVVRRKKSLGKRFKETFIEGAPKDVWGYVFFDVLVPQSKDIVSDVISSFIERMIYGDSHRGGRRSRSRHGSSYGHVDYENRYSSGSSRRREESRGMSRKGRATHDFDEIILETRVEAEEVIDRLFNRIEEFGTVSVADLYDMVGITSSYIDLKWGWMDFRGARVNHIRGGYLLDLPKPEPID